MIKGIPKELLWNLRKDNDMLVNNYEALILQQEKIIIELAEENKKLTEKKEAKKDDG